MSSLENLKASPRTSLAATIFEQLAAAILTGAITGTLAPERELAERFGVSRMLVRQGVHRLAEAGLVQVRQGGATRVLDPSECGDLRIIELFYRFGAASGPEWDPLRAHVLEKQYTQGLSLLDTFERNADAAAVATVCAAVARPCTASTRDRYEQDFWEAVAQGGGNRVLIAEVRWWYHVLVERPTPTVPAAPDALYAFYTEIGRRLQIGSGSVELYRTTLGTSRAAR